MHEHVRRLCGSGMRLIWSKRSARYDTLRHPARFSFKHLVWQDAPDIVEVDGFDIDVKEEGLLIENHCASSIVGHVEPVREKLVVNILNRFLQCDDMPLACDLLLGSAFSSTSGSWVPAVELSLFCTGERLGTLLSKLILLIRCIMFFWQMLRGILREGF